MCNNNNNNILSTGSINLSVPVFPHGHPDSVLALEVSGFEGILPIIGKKGYNNI